MPTKINMNRYSLILLCTVIFLGSCKKYLEVDGPREQLLSEDAFIDDKTADATATGMYTRLIGNISSLMRISSMTADAIVDRFNSVGNQPMVNNALKADDVNVNAAWINFYQVVYAANAILEALERAHGVSEGKKQQLRGEARFTRAFAHFMLVNFWGRVPYITTTNVAITSRVSRLPIDEVYTNIIADLKLAQTLLPVSYPTAGRARPNQAVATALLASVYLYKQDWANAETESTKLISNTAYMLSGDLNTVFLRTSTEAIWQLNTVNGFTADGVAYLVASGAPLYIFRDELVNAFEPNDKRKTNWIKTVTVSGVTYNSPNKYKARALVTVPPIPPAEDLVIFRVAEQYLIRAEARTKLDNLTDGIKDLDTIRSRAGLPATNPAIIKTDLLLAIEKERRVEFMAEMYHRWFDLKRTNRADAVLGALKPTWVTTAVLYPIPYLDLQRNPNMDPNPGY